MSITIDSNFINFAEEKLSKEISRLSNDSFCKEETKEIAKGIVALMDWSNPALMHKGFTWIAKNYLSTCNKTNI